MKKRKMVRFFLISTAAFSTLLAGCSGGTTSESNSPANGATAGGAGAASRDLPKVYFYSNNGTLANEAPQGSDPERLEEMKQLIRDKVGIDPVAIVPPKGTEVEKLNLLLSSSEKVDLFQAKWDDYATKGAIVPLNDLLDKYGPNIKKVFSADDWRSVTDKDGKIWGIPASRAYVAYPTYVRTDWLRKLNLSMPKTLDELEAVLKAFKEKDPDGNGQADSIPLATDLKSLRYGMLGGFIDGPNGYSNWIDPADNKVKPVELNPGYKDFLTKMADWYQKGYIDKEAFTKDDAPTLLKTNKVGAVVKWYSRVTLNQPKLKESFPEMDYLDADGITGPKGKLQTVTNLTSDALLISKKAEHPEAAIKFIDWTYQDISNWLTAVRGVEGKDWKWANKDKLIYETIKVDKKYGAEFGNVQLADLKYTASTTSPETGMMVDYYLKKMFLFDTAKKTIDYNIIYDQAKLLEKVPNKGDLQRLLDEESIKFIMGARPISEYDKFVSELQKAGIGQWIEEMTRQYNSFKK